MTTSQKVEPLNPVLYGLLQHKFKSVSVHNVGCAAQVKMVRSIADPTKLVETIQVAGEYYAICCPFCEDRAHKLWINYRYGSEFNPHTGRREKTYLACCYRNDCLRVLGRREQLEDLIFGQHRRNLLAPPLLRVEDEFAPPPVITPPGNIVPLCELPDTHPAIQYVRSRNFDPNELTTNYSAGFCDRPNPGFSLMKNRIYIPVLSGGQLVGWQGRAVGDTSQPKYYNSQGMQKSRVLYNYDTAMRQPYVVIVEGIPSVWRIGAAAVCLFGKTMSHWQRTTIATTWVKKPVFILLDNDAAAETEKCFTELSRHDVAVVPVFLPDTKDPADYAYPELVEILNRTAAAVGVDFVLPN